MEVGERIADTVVREVREETGLEVSGDELVGPVWKRHAVFAFDGLNYAAVEWFFAAQEAEDVDAYLALWSSKARKPNPEQLRFVFDSGDDTFHDIEITRIAPVGDLLRVLQGFEAETVTVLDVGLRRPTLDDVFLSLTGHVAEDAEQPEIDGIDAGADKESIK